MKNFKKIISLLLICTLIFGMASVFSSCGSGSKEQLSVGEYLAELTEKFGMKSYKSEKPYVKNITKSDPYFAQVQMAYEWNIIDDSNLDLSQTVSKGFVANTLVKAVGFEDVTDKNYAEIASFASLNGYTSFKCHDEKDCEREISKKEAEESLDKAFNIWANKDMGDPYSETTWGEGVADLTTLKSNDYIPGSNGTVSISKDAIKSITGKDSLSEGDIYVMPETKTQTQTPYKVGSVKDVGDYLVINNTEDTNIVDEAKPEIKSKGKIEVDFDNAIITDGAGNVVSDPTKAQNVSTYSAPKVGYLGSDCENSGTQTVGKDGEHSFNFETNGLTISGSASKDKISFSFNGSIYSSDNTSISVNSSYSVTDIYCDHDVDYGPIKGLKKAYINLHYKTTETSGIAFESKKEGVFAPEHTNGNGKFPSNFKRAILKDSDAKGAKSIKVCDVEVLGTPILNLRLVVKLEVSVSGKVTLTVTTKNGKGIDYQNGSVRFINDKEEDSKLEASGRLEFGLGIGFDVCAAGNWVRIVGAEVKFIIGAKADLTAYLTDSHGGLIDSLDIGEGSADVLDTAGKDFDGVKYQDKDAGEVTLKFESCADITTYWKIEFQINNDTIVGKAITDKCHAEWGGENDGRIDALCFHFEDGKRVGSCTRKHGEKSTTAAKEDETTVDENSYLLAIDRYSVTVRPGQKSKINIEDIPDGYDSSKIIFESSNSKIATVDNSGNVTGIADGTAVITVKTSDNKFSVKCTVLVSNTSNGGGGFR